MKLSFILKALKIFIIGISVFAVGHIIYTIIDYKNIFTALPLWTMIIFEVIFWLVVILIITGIYFLFLKFSHK